MNLDQAWGTSGTLHKRLTLESGFETARQGWLSKFNHLQMLSDRVRQLFDKHYLYKCPLVIGYIQACTTQDVLVRWDESFLSIELFSEYDDFYYLYTTSIETRLPPGLLSPSVTWGGLHQTTSPPFPPPFDGGRPLLDAAPAFSSWTRPTVTSGNGVPVPRGRCQHLACRWRDGGVHPLLLLLGGNVCCDWTPETRAPICDHICIRFVGSR